MCLVGDTLVPIPMEGAIGRATFFGKYIQRRRHHHADVAITGQMNERYLDARAKMEQWYGGTHRQAQFRNKLVKLIQDRRSLRGMAESMAGNRDDEMGHLVFYCGAISHN